MHGLRGNVPANRNGLRSPRRRDALAGSKTRNLFSKYRHWGLREVNGNGVIGQHVWFWPRRVQVRALVPQLRRCARLRLRLRTADDPGRHRVSAPCARIPTGREAVLRRRMLRVRLPPSAHAFWTGVRRPLVREGRPPRHRRRLLAFRASARVFLVGTRCPGQRRGKASCGRGVQW
jgi:hypothetical protein